jgi:hypothetical protein
MKPTLQTLAARLNRVTESEKGLALIGQIVATGDLAAIDILARHLDNPGVLGRAATQALIGFGRAAEPAMRKLLSLLDEHTIRNAHRVLATLGDTSSARAQHAYCWADLEEDAPDTERSPMTSPLAAE